MLAPLIHYASGLQLVNIVALCVSTSNAEMWCEALPSVTLDLGVNVWHPLSRKKGEVERKALSCRMWSHQLVIFVNSRALTRKIVKTEQS